MNINLNDYIKLSHEIETKGLDLEAAKTWIYPTNYPIRDYQYNIVQQALFKNTLVSLPTGLGKTFIAAVVMYNFFRWYPTGKIIFMAPTRPLVKQQIDACYDIMAIPKTVTAELTGTKLSTVRTDIWKDKRVFFITPQVLQNDLESQEFSSIGESIKCIVFDEAHKARGNYAYCEVIRKLGQISKYFRVLALSATPGNNVEDVQEIISNLQIAHLEFRIEESLDVHQYVFQRTLETIVVPLGDKLFEIRSRYIKILETYTKVLIQHKIFHGNCSTLTKGRIFMTMKEYQQQRKGDRNYGEIMKSLNICVTLYHAFELLIRHGMRGFLSFFDEHINKPLLRGNQQIISIMEDVRQYLGPAPNIEPLPNGDYPEVPENTKFGHPKFYKLREVLVEHFSKSGNESRVIVFFEYRDSVLEAFALLLQAKPLIKPRIFLGQGSGITQRIQISVVKAFREGTCNTLLSTSIGEEGLDVGEVDLIVCFDISNKSPIRMVQRMGRTGRKKAGKIIVLVTEGKEQQTLNECLIHKNNIPNHVLSSPELSRAMYLENPRMLPENYQPTCERIFINVKKPEVNKNSSLKDLFRSVRSDQPTFPDDLIIIQTKDRIRDKEMLFCKPNFECKDINNLIFRNVEKQRSLQQNYRVSHSKNSKMLVNLLQLADSKRFNIPMSQIQSSQTSSEVKLLRQGDIRNFVSQKAKSVVPTAADETTNQNGTDLSQFNEFFNEITAFVSIQMSNDRDCKLCRNFLKCSSPIKAKEIKTPLSVPDVNILKNITANDLKNFCRSNFDDPDDFDTSMNDNMDEVFENSKIISIFDNIEAVNKGNESFRNTITTEEKICTSNYLENKEMELDKFKVGFELPSNINSILHKNRDSLTNENLKEPELENLDMDEILRFFKLSSIEEMFPKFRSETDETIIYSPETKEIFNVETPPKKITKLHQDVSPDLFDSDSGQDFHDVSFTNFQSPILTMKSQTKSFNSSMVKKDSSIVSESPIIEINTPIKESNDFIKKSPVKSVRKQLNFITIEKKSPINKTNCNIVEVSDNCSYLDLVKSKSLNKTLTENDIESPKKLVSNINFNKLKSFNKTLKNTDLESPEKFIENLNLREPKYINETLENIDFESSKELFSNSKRESPECLDLKLMKNLTEKKSLNNTIKGIDFQSPKKLSSGIKQNSEYLNKTTNKNVHSSEIENNSNYPISSESLNKLEENLSILDDLNSFVDMSFFKNFSQEKSQKNVEKCDNIKPQTDNKNNDSDSDITFVDENELNISPRNAVDLNTNILADISSEKELSEASYSEDFAKDSIDLLSELRKKADEEYKNDLDDLTEFQLNDMQNFCDISLLEASIKKKMETEVKTVNDSIAKPVEKLDNFKVPSPFVQNKKLSTLGHSSKIDSSQSQISISQMLSLLDNRSITEFPKTPDHKKTVSKINASITESPQTSHNLSILNQSNCLTSTFSTPKHRKTSKLSTNKNASSDFIISRIRKTQEKSKVEVEDPYGNISDISGILDSSLNENETNSDEEFADLINISQSPIFAKPKPKKAPIKKKQSIAKEFIDDEAVLSDETFVISDDEDETNLDRYEKSFVADETQLISTQVHANYLKSVKSPLNNRGNFIIRKRRHNISNVFSQVVNNEDDTYMEDSFVVDEDDELAATQDHDLSELELLELKLKEQKRKRKQSKNSKTIAEEQEKSSKRRRIIVLSSDSE